MNKREKWSPPPRPEPMPLFTGYHASGDGSAWVIALLPFIVVIIIALGTR
jgi:hypothetical protein